jgi:hypothetical protein
MMTSDMSVLLSTSMGMRSHMPLAVTTLANTMAATSFKGPTTNRSHMSGTSTPASISLLPLLSSADMLRSTLNAAAFSKELLVLHNISTNVRDTLSPARAFPSVVNISQTHQHKERGHLQKGEGAKLPPRSLRREGLTKTTIG